MISLTSLSAVLVLLAAAPVDAAPATLAAMKAPSIAAPAFDAGKLEELKRQSDWVGLERLSRQTLTGLQSTPLATSAESATVTLFLADALQGQGHYPEAEDLYLRAVTMREKVLGSDHLDTAVGMEDLALALITQGRQSEAEPVLRRALAIKLKALGSDDAGTARSENSLAKLLRVEGRYAEAEPHFRRALAIREKALGPDHPDTAASLYSLGLLLWSEGRFPEAESFVRRSLQAREKTLGPDHPDTAQSVGGLALIVHDEGRYAEAEPLYRRSLAVKEKTLGSEHPDVALDLNNLGSLLWDEGRVAEVEPLFRRALSIQEKALGPEHPDTAMSMNNLAFILQAEGRQAEAEPLFRRALEIDEKVLGPEHTDVAIVIRSIAELLQAQGRYAEAEPLFRRAVRIDEKALGPEHPDTADAHQSLGFTEEKQGQFDKATLDYRGACSLRSSMASSREQIGEAASMAKTLLTRCSVRLALSLWGWSEGGGRRMTGDTPVALEREAFVAAQRAALSASGEAMARSAALAAARASGVGDEADAYEVALVDRDGLEQQFAKAAGETGQAGVEHRALLARARAEALNHIAALTYTLKARAPRYWDFRAPEPVDFAALQTRFGPDASLLNRNEALIMFMVPPGEDQGLVFAVSKGRTAWARIGLTGKELKARVDGLRAQIEARHRAFDRRSAYELYVALIGAPAIQAVIRDAPVLLFVPSGPLTSLPPGLLVTAPPEGGAPGDADQTRLRATPWLLRSKAVALLPSVSSLRTLRQLTAIDRVAASDPLLAFADPDFAGPGSPMPPGSGADIEQSRRIGEALRRLPRLPGARLEGEALERALGGRPGSLLTGVQASKAELMARNVDGRLARVRVLEFATHGLVAGEAAGLAEPALALAAGAKAEDALLLASEASTLKLDAEWVLLSACNTASPDAPESQGLSGLSRAFFFAGARSLLISHWPVRDDIAARLIPATLLAERNTPGLSRAEALQRASLAILDDPALHAANPAAWAPFSLVGESSR